MFWKRSSEDLESPPARFKFLRRVIERSPYIPDSLETLHWLYSVEQRSVIPIKWLVLLLAISILLIEDRSYFLDWQIILCLSVYTVANLLFTWVFVGRKVPVRHFRRWSHPSLVLDVVFISLMILFTGRLDSSFFYLFFMPILRSAALFQDPLLKFYGDVLMTLVYLVCAYPVSRGANPEVTALIMLRITLLWGVILMSSFLVQVLTSQQKRILGINERLRYQSEQNREVLSSMSDAVLVFDPSQQLRICNRSAEELLHKLMGVRTPLEGLPTDSDLWNRYWQEPPRLFGERPHLPWEGGEGAYTFWANLTPDLIATPIERLLDEARFKPGNRIQGVPVILSEKGGTKRSFIASVASLGQSSEARLGWLVLLRDISEYQSMEAQLLTAEKMAAVGRLAAGLAHELGNPLGIIKSCANYLKKKIVGAQHTAPRHDPLLLLEEEVEVLASEAERCEKILRQLLTFASRDQLRLNELDLKELLQKAINLVDYQAPEEIHLGFYSTLSAAPCRTDENLLIQALVNLLLNAVQSIHEQGRVDVYLEEGESQFLSSASARSWKIRIRDTGCGMGKETLERLYEPFYTTKPSGTGLGLSITQRILHRLGGTITAQSEYGRGTEFTLHIPINTEDWEGRWENR
jgi:signal transduction histidine kinase